VSEFENKVVLVTGGTRGIGRACAEAFAKDGAKVAICGRNEETARAAAEELGNGVRGYGADMASSEAVDAMFKAIAADLGPVGILVNNAGLVRDGLVLRMKNDDWNTVIAADLSGPFYCCRAAARDMIKARWGRIINISSVIGLHGQAGQTNYAAAKAGIRLAQRHRQRRGPRVHRHRHDLRHTRRRTQGDHVAHAPRPRRHRRRSRSLREVPRQRRRVLRHRRGPPGRRRLGYVNIRPTSRSVY
jgi:NAD(P)-dependent dehydrogenase (short-subunit alcohol dehydrogenase family)